MRIIKAKITRDLGYDQKKRHLYLALYKHPRKLEEENTLTVEEINGKHILTVAGTDKDAGEYDVRFI